eukprot:TRINITY_DN5183_c0_g1_i2.p1 TRINITY_DN5183_c0_g1~~TRINITY_DN5183_c0_g1_i2.p1  ORF type:complete len:293 (+),score=31.50 TRINITY_DN5183_c0_g1_i2:258-1136(+)
MRLNRVVVATLVTIGTCLLLERIPPISPYFASAVSSVVCSMFSLEIFDHKWEIFIHSSIFTFFQPFIMRGLDVGYLLGPNLKVVLIQMVIHVIICLAIMRPIFPILKEDRKIYQTFNHIVLVIFYAIFCDGLHTTLKNQLTKHHTERQMFEMILRDIMITPTMAFFATFRGDRRSLRNFAEFLLLSVVCAGLLTFFVERSSFRSFGRRTEALVCRLVISVLLLGFAHFFHYRRFPANEEKIAAHVDKKRKEQSNPQGKKKQGLVWLRSPMPLFWLHSGLLHVSHVRFVNQLD